MVSMVNRSLAKQGNVYLSLFQVCSLAWILGKFFKTNTQSVYLNTCKISSKKFTHISIIEVCRFQYHFKLHSLNSDGNILAKKIAGITVIIET